MYESMRIGSDCSQLRGARCTKNSIAVIACGLNGVACEAHNTPITGLIATKTSPFMIHIGEKNNRLLYLN
jgi:hypothetical protein